jgi:hypothetical protein
MLADRLGCHNIVAESDSSDIIEACLGSENWWTDSTPIYADCVDLVASIGEVTFNHCRRDANKAAHEVAKECFLNGRIGYLPKSSSALDHLSKVDCTLVKYPTKGLVVFMIYPKGVLCKLTNYPLIGHENDYFGASLF